MQFLHNILSTGVNLVYAWSEDWLLSDSYPCAKRKRPDEIEPLVQVSVDTIFRIRPLRELLQ